MAYGDPREALIAGYLETSLNDVIGEVSFVIWFCGCNLRCPYCQNFPMVISDRALCHTVSLDGMIEKIEEAKPYIDYVQVTGGEPTLQEKQLGYLYGKTKEIGINTSLDTNGTRPQVIEGFIKKGILDHVAMDIKAPLKPHKYAKASGISPNKALLIIEKIGESLEIVSKMEFVEIRTTYVPGIVDEKDIVEIADLLGSYLTKNRHYYIIQQFIPNKNAPDPRYKTGGLVNIEQLKRIAYRIQDKVPNIAIRHIEGVEYIKTS